MTTKPPEVVPGPAAPLPPGLIVSGADLSDPATASRLAGVPADFPAGPGPRPGPRPAPGVVPGIAPGTAPGPAPEKPPASDFDMRISKSEAQEPCRRCGYDGRQTATWLKSEDYGKLVDQLLFDGTFQHTFKLGPLAVTFRTLAATEEDRCWDDAIVGLGTGPTATAEAMRRQTNYEFAIAVAAVEGTERRYTAPDEIQSPKATYDALTAFLRSGPVRTAVRNAYFRFQDGINRALVETAAPNF